MNDCFCRHRFVFWLAWLERHSVWCHSVGLLDRCAVHLLGLLGQSTQLDAQVRLFASFSMINWFFVQWSDCKVDQANFEPRVPVSLLNFGRLRIDIGRLHIDHSGAEQLHLHIRTYAAGRHRSDLPGTHLPIDAWLQHWHHHDGHSGRTSRRLESYSRYPPVGLVSFVLQSDWDSSVLPDSMHAVANSIGQNVGQLDSNLSMVLRFLPAFHVFHVPVVCVLVVLDGAQGHVGSSHSAHCFDRTCGGHQFRTEAPFRILANVATKLAFLTSLDAVSGPIGSTYRVERASNGLLWMLLQQ